MRATWLRVRGYLAGALAFVACPCHLPLTLPLILGLSAGTAFGGWLADNSGLIYALATLLFLGGLVQAYRWLTVQEAAACEIERRPRQVSAPER